MNLRLSGIVLCVLFASCNSKEPGISTNTSANSAANPTANSSVSPAAAGNASTAKSKIDPCSLLTSDEIKAVQGEAFANAMRSDREDGDLIVAQCYYALPTSVNSVVLNVTTAKDTAGAPSPRTFWEGTFGKEAAEKDRNKEKEKERGKRPASERREEEGEEAAPKPEKVSGLGEEAFWIGSRVGGALYVLKKNLFFRISVGGASDERAKLNKSRTLAQNALKRL